MAELYHEVINGVDCYSNIPFHQTPEASIGNYSTFKYVHVIKFTSNITEDLYIDSGQLQNQINEYIKNNGSNSTISNLKWAKTSDDTITIEYTATSPIPIIVILGLIAIIGVIIYLIIGEINSNVTPIGQLISKSSNDIGGVLTTVDLGAIGIIILGIGVIAYLILK